MKADDTAPLPSFIADCPETLEAWGHFVEMRKANRRNKWTALARKRALDKLAAMHQAGTDVAEVLLTCAEFSWIGVEWGERHVLKHSRRPGQVNAADPRFAPSRQRMALETLGAPTAPPPDLIQ